MIQDYIAQHKRIIALMFIATLLLVAGWGIYSWYLSTRPPVEISVSKTSAKSTAPATTVDFGEYSSAFTDSQRSEISQGIMNTSVNNNNKLSSIKASVRRGSFSKEIVDGVPSLSVLVDVPELPNTFIVSYDGGENYAYNILNIHCAPVAERMSGAGECKDVE